MTTPTAEDPFPPQADVFQDAPPPFADMATFELTKTINLGQLEDEIRAALSRQVNAAQTGPEDVFAPISADNKAELAVSPGDVDAAVVTQAISDHQPMEGYGVPAYIQDFDGLLHRVANNPDEPLSGEDVERGVRGLLLRESNRRSVELLPGG